MNAITALYLQGTLARITAIDGAGFAEAMSGVVTLGLIAYPIVALIKSVVFATIAWNVAVLLDSETRFARILPVFLWAEVLQGLKGPATVAVYYLRNVRSVADLEVHWGIGLFMEPTTTRLARVDAYADMFALAWAWYVARHLAEVTGMSRWSTGVVAVLLLIAVALVAILSTPQI